MGDEMLDVQTNGRVLVTEAESWKGAAENCLKRLERAHDEADKYQVRALAAEAKLREQQAREELVQEVIHLTSLHARTDDHYWRTYVVTNDLLAACRKLAEWRP